MLASLYLFWCDGCTSANSFWNLFTTRIISLSQYTGCFALPLTSGPRRRTDLEAQHLQNQPVVIGNCAWSFCRCCPAFPLLGFVKIRACYCAGLETNQCHLYYLALYFILRRNFLTKAIDRSHSRFFGRVFIHTTRNGCFYLENYQ